MKTLDQTDKVRINRILRTYFNTNELNDLCFSLSIDPDDLPHAHTLSGKAREIVTYAARHNLSDKLIAEIRRLRPHVDFTQAVRAKRNGIFPLEYRTFVGQNSHALNSLNIWFEKYKKGDSSFYAIIQGEGGIGKTALATHFAAIDKEEEIEGDIYKVDANLSDISHGIRKLAQYVDFDSRIESWTENDYPNQKILEQLPNDSILILDNVGSYAGYDTLIANRSKLFVIITVRVREATPFSQLGHECYGFDALTEWSREDCQNFIEKRLPEEILTCTTDNNLDRLFGTLPSKNPLFLEKLCQIMERFYTERRIRNIDTLVPQLSKNVG